MSTEQIQTSPNGTETSGAPACDSLSRANRAFGPIFAGVIIDLVDLATFGPIGLAVGLPIGGLAGFWMGKCLRLSNRACLGCAIAAGVYCTIPFTELLPLATLVGAYARFMEGVPSAKDKSVIPPENPSSGKNA